MTILLLNQIVPANISSDFVETFGISDNAEGLNFTETLTASDLWVLYSVTPLNFSDSISTPIDSYSDYSLCNGVVDCNYSDFSFSSTAISSGVGQLNCVSPICTLDIEATNTAAGVLDLTANCSFSGSAVIGQSGILAVENNYSKAEMVAGIDLSTIPTTGILSCENSNSTLQLYGIVDVLGNINATLFGFSSALQSTLSSVAIFNPIFGSYLFYVNSLESNVATMQMEQDYNTLEMTGTILPTAVMTMYNDRIVLEGNTNAEYY